MEPTNRPPVKRWFSRKGAKAGKSKTVIEYLPDADEIERSPVPRMAQLTMHALIAAFVIGLMNTFIRPVLVVLTLPVTVLTLGLFMFVINALMFWAAAGLLDGFHVNGFAAALIGSVLYSLMGIVIESALERLFAKM